MGRRRLLLCLGHQYVLIYPLESRLLILHLLHLEMSMVLPSTWWVCLGWSTPLTWNRRPIGVSASGIVHTHWVSLLTRSISVICVSLFGIFNTLEEGVAQPAFCRHLNQDLLRLFRPIALLPTLLLQLERTLLCLCNFMIIKPAKLIGISCRTEELFLLRLIVDMKWWSLGCHTL